MLIFFLYLTSTGFFRTTLGAGLLALALAAAGVGLIFFARRMTPNPKALKGTKGLIVSEVKRVDEREIVFARNRSIRPGSKEYDVFYGRKPKSKAPPGWAGLRS